MQRSRSQVLFSYLPGAVFRHEDRIYGRVVAVDGSRLTSLNEAVIYQEIATYLDQWHEDQRHDLPLPRAERIREYRILKPEVVKFELFPLVFECSRRSCSRVHTFFRFEDLANEPRCRHCHGSLQQLQFYNAHNCGRTRPIRGARCATHGYDHITFDNTGSFTSATWRCAGAGCNGAVISRTNMSPCNCNSFPGPDGVVRMHAHTLDDSRAYRAHYIDLINIDSSVFQTYQAHPARIRIAVAHYLGLLDGIREGIREADTSDDGTKRMTAAQWTVKEQQYRDMGLPEDDIASLRRTKGPVDSGIAALDGVPSAILERLASRRPFYERAAVYDTNEVRRLTLTEQLDRARARRDMLQAEALEAASDLAAAMGISELAVTWEFPIAKAAFGYTRERHEPGQAALRGFRHPKQNDGKHPVYAVASETEALLVTLSARDVIAFLAHGGEHTGVPSTEPEARLQILQIFADEDVHPAPARTVRVLVHTLSHLLLRGLDDGQVGFAESSLAEWLVPEALTFGVYANTLKEFTLGSLWTLITNRALSWLNDVVARSVRCENDPICYQRPERACERCSYLTFGCRLFNDDLDRRVLYDFLFSRGVLHRTDCRTGH
ncbi:hypothetical protein [Nocardioides speluncae]|uniref:hypothetical protein n=1 Tax=Nocardioides speluncae TaxID=2670337 RepID=UPI000D69F9D7|nr:hypothetical protein [Nocardioides speluncae]